MQTKKVPITTQHQVLAYLEHAEKQVVMSKTGLYGIHPDSLDKKYLNKK